MKNAGKACNNRLYRHIRTFEKIVKNYFVIYNKLYSKTPTSGIYRGSVLFIVVDRIRRNELYRRVAHTPALAALWARLRRK